MRASGHRKKQLEKRGSLAMLKQRQCGTISGRIGLVAAKAGKLKTVLAAVVITGVLSLMAYVFCSRLFPAPAQPVSPLLGDVETLPPADGGESSLLGDTPLVGRLTTEIDPIESPTPAGIPVGRRPGEADAPDLSTPAVAMYSALALIDKGATDELTQCCVNGTNTVVNGLYPRYLGHPIELVEVIEDANAATVIWQATVHTGFTVARKNWSPGESMPLTTRLVRVEGLWKLLRLHDGDKDGPQ
jgi:hypothetical protein